MSSALQINYFSTSASKAAHGFLKGDAIGYSGGNFFKACGDTVANSKSFIGFCASVIDANNFILEYDGIMSGLFSGLVASTTYYLDPNPANAGKLTAVYPTGDGEIAKPVLIATSATTGFLVKQQGVMVFPSNKIQYKTGTDTYTGITLEEGSNITITQDGDGNYTISAKTSQDVTEIKFPGVNISVVGPDLVFAGVIPLLVPGLSTTQDLNIKDGKTLKFYNVGNTNFVGLKAPSTSTNPVFEPPFDYPFENGSSLTADTDGAFDFAPLPGRNMIINGAMQWWQRGADGAATFTVTNNTIYTADRFQFKSFGAATTARITQVEGAVFGTYFAKCQRVPGSVGTDDIVFATSLPIYRCIGAANSLVVLSFNAYKGANYSAALSQLNVKIITGTGDDDVSAITTGFVGQATPVSSNVVITGVNTRYRVHVPASLAANITQLAVAFTTVPTGVAGADDSFYVTDIQLERGLTATPFDRKDESTEIQRFCWKTFKMGTAPASGVGETTGEFMVPATQSGATTTLIPSIRHPNIMSNAPIVTVFNPVNANNQFYDETFGGDCSATTQLQATDRSMSFVTNGNAGTVAGNILAAHFLVESELL